MASLHIGTITFDWHPYEVRELRLVQAGVDAGHHVDVICLRQPQQKRYEVVDGAHVYRVPMNRGDTRSVPLTILFWCWFLLIAGAKVTALHLKRPYDVIHVHNMPDFLVFAALVPKLLGAKVILDVQDVSPELMAARCSEAMRGLVTRLAIWQERVSAAFADHVLTTGSLFESKLLQRGVPREKLSSVLNSPDPKLFPASRRSLPSFEPPTEERPFIVMYHGTLAKRNRLDTALHALAIARRVVPHVRLAIHGNGEQLSELKRLAVELKITESVAFSEVCPPDQVVDFVVHGDVGIIPYGRDGFMELVLPTKAYEYSWMQRPIIGSDTEAIRSMFRPDSIILCDPTKPEEFAEAIIDLYQHPEKRMQMIEQAGEDFQPYRWENMKEHYIELLASLGYKQTSGKVSMTV